MEMQMKMQKQMQREKKRDRSGSRASHENNQNPCIMEGTILTSTHKPAKPKIDTQAVLTLWNDGWTLDEIAAHIGRVRTTIHAAIRQAQAEGLARRGWYAEPEEAPPLAALWLNTELE